MTKKLTFDEAMQRLDDDRVVNSDDVLATALRRKIWTSSSCFPGCLNEYSCISETKQQAIDSLEGIIPDEAKGWRNSLRRYHQYRYGGMIYEIDDLTLGGIL